MRIGSASALILSAFALAACTGVPTTGTTTDITTLAMCGLACPSSTVAGTTTTPPVTTPPAGSNSGNTTNLSTGDKTIALEAANLVSPLIGGAYSTLTETAGAPNTARLQIDTKAASNANWPIPKTMDEYVFGTNATGGTGLGGTYKEYRSLSPSSSGTLVDEELQIWHWGNSYATQYRDVNGAGDAAHQAWSFGGTATAAMPLGGNANYAGKYGATSKTWNWIDDPLNLAQTLSANGSWRVEGDSSIQADFGAATMTGTLTPNTWTGVQTLNGGIGPKTVISSNAADPNWVPFMATNVILTGKITGNTVSGKAELDPTAGWVSGINPMNAGFFGPAAPNPTEVTGDYNFVAVTPKPIGGVPPINNDVRGFVQQSGVFHAQ